MLRFRSPILPFLLLCLVIFYSPSGFAQGQHYVSPQEVRVSGLSTATARSTDPSDILRASLDVVLHDSEVCCGKDSALEDASSQADPKSLKDVAAKLQGRHLLSDGRPIQVAAAYIEPDKLNAGLLISTLHDNHPLLLQWNSHLYICIGVTYVKDYDPETGAQADTITTFLLQDARYSDTRRDLIFDRNKDDWSKVQGVLWAKVDRP
jgi:hypothetical protein